MTTEGSLGERGLGEVLPAIAAEGSTGILTVQGHHEIIAFAFLKGGIVSADALNQTLEEGLGQVLADLSLVSPEQFAELAAEYQAGGGQVVDLLVERGFIERDELLAAVRTHTYRLCRQALQWTAGDYKFYQGDEVSYEDGVEPISSEELLTRASRDLGAELLPGGVPDDDVVYTRTKGAQAPEAEADGAGFTAVDQQVASTFKLINGKRSVAELAEASGLPAFRVAYFLSRWEAGGLAERSRKKALVEPQTADEAPGPVPKARAKAKAKASGQPRRSRLAEWWASRRERSQPTSLPWPSRVIGLAFVAAFVWSFAGVPTQILLPFPWQRGLQESLERERTSAVLSRLRLANSAHFLLHGRFAEDLEGLARTRLLPSSALTTTEGAKLAYSATEESYVVSSVEAGGPEQETFLQETVRGNFLLDPELEPPLRTRRAPLVLLD